MPSSRQLAGLAPLFLWASEGDVRHFGSASNAPQSLTAALPSSRQPASLPLLFLWASLWPVRSLSPLFLWASEGNVRHFGSASSAPQSLTAALPSSRQLAGLAPLFLWASEGNVRHFGPPSNAPRQLAGLLRPLCGLSEACLLSSYGPLCGLSEACLLSSYGLPKATLGILDRLQTLLGSWQACCGLSGSHQMSRQMPCPSTIKLFGARPLKNPYIL